MLQVDELWSRLGGDLRGYVSRRVSDPSATEDLVQEIFLRVQQRKDEVRDDTSLAPWVFRVARSVVVDHLRERRPHAAPIADDVADVTDEDDDRASARVLATWIGGMVSTLPEPYREAITLTDLQGLSQAEAAKRLGLSYSGFKSRVQRGREKLRSILLRCCAVDLDRRGGVVDFQRRDGDCC